MNELLVSNIESCHMVRVACLGQHLALGVSAYRICPVSGIQIVPYPINDPVHYFMESNIELSAVVSLPFGNPLGRVVGAEACGWRSSAI